MSGRLDCPACVIRTIDPGGPEEWRDPSCTGRRGCVRSISERDAAAGYRSRDTLNGPAPVRAAGTEGGATFDMLLPSEAWDEIVPHPLVPFGFAPGGYFCRCSGCGQKFSGDKRAHHCRLCAERQLHRAEITRLRSDRAARDRAVAEAVRDECSRVVGSRTARYAVDEVDLDAVIASIAKESTR